MISLTFAPVGLSAVNKSYATSATAPLDKLYDQSHVDYYSAGVNRYDFVFVNEGMLTGML